MSVAAAGGAPPPLSPQTEGLRALRGLGMDTMEVNGCTYLKLKVIGRGMSGAVYKALRYPDMEIFAIKVVELKEDQVEFTESYKHEISLLQRLRGKPGIIQLEDSEVTDTHVTIVCVRVCLLV
jgi:serine/threonine protein kinase